MSHLLPLLCWSLLIGCEDEPCPADSCAREEGCQETECEDTQEAPTEDSQLELDIEARGTWLHPTDYGTEPKAAEAAIAAQVERLTGLGFNLFVPLVENHGAYYASDVTSAYEGWDAFDYPQVFLDAVRASQAAVRAEVHLWTAVYNMADLLASHPEYAAVAKDGVPSTSMACPNRPEVHAHALALVEELMDRYPGVPIHLDYVRHTEVSCFCEHCRAAFQDLYGADPVKMSEELQETWFSWRAAQVTAFVADVRAASQARDPAPLISAAVFGIPSVDSARDQLGQDWVAWLEDGLLDVAMPMLYTPDYGEFVNTTVGALEATGRQHHVYIGIGAYLVDEIDQPFEPITEYRLARALDTEGTVTFRAAYVDEELGEQLAELWAMPALLPHATD